MIRRTPPKRRRPKPGFSEVVKQTISHRSHGMCELDFCGPAVHYHHRAPRGAGGTSLPWVNQAANGLHLALACHNRIEREDRAIARKNGWLVDRNGLTTAAEEKVLRRGVWVLLSDDGSISPEGAA